MFSHYSSYLQPQVVIIVRVLEILRRVLMGALKNLMSFFGDDMCPKFVL